MNSETNAHLHMVEADSWQAEVEEGHGSWLEERRQVLVLTTAACQLMA